MKAVVDFLIQRVLQPLIIFLGERVFGWHMADHFPKDLPKYMFVAEYHTSNWDIMVMLYAMAKERQRLRFIIKKEVESWFIIGRVLRGAGAVFIDRSSPLSAIKTVMKAVRGSDKVVLLICPSGTRKYSEGWQPGFYYIAEKLKLPLVPGSPDFATRTVCIGDPIYPSGDIDADVAEMAAFFSQTQAKHPEYATPVRLLPPANAEQPEAVPA